MPRTGPRKKTAGPALQPHRAVSDAGRSALAAAFVRRYAHLLQRLGDIAPAEALENALAAPDDMGGLAGLLAEVAPLDPPRPDPLAAARARGAQAKQELMQRAGGGHRAGEVAERLGVSPQAVHARRQRGTLLAVSQPNGEFLYPVCQFGEHGTVPGLDRFLRAFRIHSPWTRLAVLLSPHPALDGKTPREALLAGDVAGAVLAARTYGEHLG